MEIELTAIHKSFGPVRANDGITLKLPGGRIHGLLGENGAGKSTLMKILSGYQPADSGEIVLDGQSAALASPADAIRQGVGMLHQDPLDVPPFSVLENFIYGRPDTGFIPNRRKARAEFTAISERFGFSIDPEAYIDMLSIGARQELEIVRLLSTGVRALILDEPTTGISTDQKETLFRTLRELADDGMNIIFVSHKLEEVQELCDDVAVLRHGKLIGTLDMPATTDEIVRLMFGEVPARTPRADIPPGDPVLELENITLYEGRLTVQDISMHVRRSEVIGLAGLDGSGQAVALRACAGLRTPFRGRVLLNGKDMTGHSYRDFIRGGVFFAAAGRLEEGLVEGLTLAEHFALVDADQGAFIDRERIAATTRAQIERFNVIGRPESEIQQLSGGNQQRVLLALMPPDLKALLLEYPTRGLDVESARWVWEQILARREDGTAILFTSPDLGEIVEYSDRIIVFFNGQLTEVTDPAHTTAEKLGTLIGGGQV